ncbi:MAG TPA: hypothetical protein VI452_15945 [Marmoricola sp.]
MDMRVAAEQVREAEQGGAQLQAERLRQLETELAARDELLRQYLSWAQQAGVRPLSRRGARRLGIAGLYRRRDRFWLVARGAGPIVRGRHVVRIAGVYASGETVVRGFKAHELAECIAQRAAEAGRPWAGDSPEAWTPRLRLG